jgi:hypothetical protein
VQDPPAPQRSILAQSQKEPGKSSTTRHGTVKNIAKEVTMADPGFRIGFDFYLRENSNKLSEEP